MPQVCSERIVLHAGPNAVDLVAGAVRPLLEADLPMVLWWTTDPKSNEALFRDLGDECSRLLLDLPDPGTSAASLMLGLDPAICSCSRDTVWFGLTRWRELVAQFFDPPCHHETLERVDSLQIEAFSPDPSSPSATGDLAGGLAGRPARLEAAREAGEAAHVHRAARSGPRSWVPSGHWPSRSSPRLSRRDLPADPRMATRSRSRPAVRKGSRHSASGGQAPIRPTSGSRPRPPTTAGFPAWSAPLSSTLPAGSPPPSTPRAFDRPVRERAADRTVAAGACLSPVKGYRRILSASENYRHEASAPLGPAPLRVHPAPAQPVLVLGRRVLQRLRMRREQRIAEIDVQGLDRLRASSSAAIRS